MYPTAALQMQEMYHTTPLRNLAVIATDALNMTARARNSHSSQFHPHLQDPRQEPLHRLCSQKLLEFTPVVFKFSTSHRKLHLPLQALVWEWLIRPLQTHLLDHRQPRPELLLDLRVIAAMAKIADSLGSTIHCRVQTPTVHP